jgi:hypothetical protein
MKQSEIVKEASRWALSKLSHMSKEELSRRLAERVDGPVGQMLLATGTLDALLYEEDCPWSLGIDVIHVKFISEFPVGRYAADTRVDYALAHTSFWTGSSQFTNGTWDFVSEDQKWAKAA